MMSALYSGATGIKVHGEGINVVSNNLANVNTVGFKQKSALFQDLISQNLVPGQSMVTSTNQLGMGATLGAVRTLHTDGTYESSNTVTDVSISGKGFFQVTKGDETHYTRAGNFRFNNEGFLLDAADYNVSGIKIEDGKEVGDLEPIKIDLKGELSKNPPKATESAELQLNLGVTQDKNTNQTDPFFALFSSYDAQINPKPVSSYTQPFNFYDSEGTRHAATINFDLAGEVNGQKVMEYTVSMDPKLDARAAFAENKKQGMLMTGTLTFSTEGKLIDFSAFTPADGADPSDLANWKPASIKNGIPEFTVELEGQEPQKVALGFGLKSSTDSWNSMPENAAAVGDDRTLLPNVVPAEPNGKLSTSYGNSSYQVNYDQDGYGRGDLADLQVGKDGTITAHYTNGVALDLYSIPLFRFNSEDGLANTGMNHFLATPEAGDVEYGKAGTSNYGKISGFSLENSNVETSVEMVNLIITQRGFQTNSKTIMTADTMLQKALELKRY